jgi:hypothetical protein
MLLLETQYFPSIHFFMLIAQTNHLCLEQHENYTKQTYRNRCYILGANKIERLTVPVISLVKGEKQAIREVKLDYSQNWQQIHWRTIQSAYGKSPYFVYYGEAIQAVLFEKTETLFELNEKIIRLLCKLLALSTEIDYTTTYQNIYQPPIIDARNSIAPVNGLIDDIANNIIIKPYLQVFGNRFVNNLSILDLLFCKGNMASSYLGF